MFLRATQSKKDGKEHRYWSVVENVRPASGPPHQKTLLYYPDGGIEYTLPAGILGGGEA